MTELLEREASAGDKVASIRLAAFKALASDWEHAALLLEAVDPRAASHLRSVMHENAERSARDSRRLPARSEQKDDEAWETEQASALAGDARAAMSVSFRLQGLGNLEGAEEVLRSTLRQGRQDQWPYRTEAMMRLAGLLRDKGDLEAGEWLRTAAAEGSDEASELAAQWCLENGLAEEGEFRFEVLAQRGRAEMRSAVSYLDSEWKIYRHQWTETIAGMWVWCRAMRRQMLRAAGAGDTQQAMLFLCAVSEARGWSPQPEDIVVNALLEQVKRPLNEAWVGAFWRAEAWSDEVPASRLLDPKELAFGVVDWVTRTLLPAVLDTAGRADSAELLAGMCPVTDRLSAEAASSVLGRLHADPWEDVQFPQATGEWDKQLKRMARWRRADDIAARSLLADLGLDPQRHSGDVFRLLSGKLIWSQMAHATGTEAAAWIYLWDKCSRIYVTAMRWASGHVAEVIYGRDPVSMIDPELAIEAALSETISTLKAGQRARFLVPKSSVPEHKEHR